MVWAGDCDIKAIGAESTVMPLSVRLPQWACLSLPFLPGLLQQLLSLLLGQRSVAARRGADLPRLGDCQAAAKSAAAAA